MYANDIRVKYKHTLGYSIVLTDGGVNSILMSLLTSFVLLFVGRTLIFILFLFHSFCCFLCSNFCVRCDFVCSCCCCRPMERGQMCIQYCLHLHMVSFHTVCSELYAHLWLMALAWVFFVLLSLFQVLMLFNVMLISLILCTVHQCNMLKSSIFCKLMMLRHMPY